MISVLVALFLSLRSCLRSRAVLQLEVLALRHQLQVLNRSRPRLRLVLADRVLWAWLSRSWIAWRTALVIVKPETVIGPRGPTFRTAGRSRKSTPAATSRLGSLRNRLQTADRGVRRHSARRRRAVS